MEEYTVNAKILTCRKFGDSVWNRVGFNIGEFLIMDGHMFICATLILAVFNLAVWCSNGCGMHTYVHLYVSVVHCSALHFGVDYTSSQQKHAIYPYLLYTFKSCTVIEFTILVKKVRSYVDGTLDIHNIHAILCLRVLVSWACPKLFPNYPASLLLCRPAFKVSTAT